MTSRNLGKRVARLFPDGVPRLAKIARINDRATGTTYEELVFKKERNGLATHVFERGKSADLRSLHRELLNAGARLPASFDQAKPVLERAVEQDPAETHKWCAQVGWQGTSMRFSLHGKVLGSRSSQPPQSVDRMRHVPRPRGTRAAWAELAGYTRYSSRLTLALSAAFAAPLLRFAGLQPFGVMLYGKSKTGKSTAALAAASVVGFGRESELPNWDTTQAGFQEMARNFNDHLLPLNELALASTGNRRGRYEILRSVIYGYAEGAERTRHSASGFAAPARAATWRGICLATSEQSASELAAAAGMTRDEGEIARLWDVPAVRPGRKTIFDSVPAGTVDKIAWRSGAMGRIREIAAEHHGRALKCYVEHLRSYELAALEQRVREAIAAFEEHMALDNASGAVSHAIKNFGLLYAGGLEAIEAGLLPIPATKLLMSIAMCFNDGLKAMPLPEAEELRGRDALLKGTAKTEWRSARPAFGEPVMIPWDRANGKGYRRKVRNKRVYAISTAEFDSWFGTDEAAKRAALNWLYIKGRLLRKSEATFNPSRPTRESYTKFLKIKDKNYRAVQFYDLDDD